MNKKSKAGILRRWYDLKNDIKNIKSRSKSDLAKTVAEQQIELIDLAIADIKSLL